MSKTMYCTLDTETVGGAINPTGIYNFGCVIHDREGNIYATTSLLAMEHFDEIRNDSYAKKNFPLYIERLERGDISAVATEEEALAVIRNLCHFYDVKYIMAFNTGFDLERTICRELKNDFEFIDIYLMALQTVTHLKKYAKFCIENGFKSRSGKTCATNAQTLYAFITDNPEYKEEHTALADALIEMEIFKRCLRMHKKFTKNMHQHDTSWESGYNKCFPPFPQPPRAKKESTPIKPSSRKRRIEGNFDFEDDEPPKTPEEWKTEWEASIKEVIRRMETEPQFQ